MSSESPTRPATPPTTSVISTRRLARPTWATWPACGSPPHEYTVAPTPPPEIDVEAWLASIDFIGSVGAVGPLSHPFRAVRGRGRAARAVRESLRTRSRRARDSNPEEFAAWSEAETRRAVDVTTAEALLQAAPPEQLGLGLRRYWEKVAV